MPENPYKSPTADKEALKQLIREAFADVEYPGDSRLKGSNEGDEPFLLEKEFAGKDNWQSLSPSFLDNASDALSFFSAEAFRFYIPAYIIADINEQLKHASPEFHLWHGLDNCSGSERVNPL